MCFSARVRQDLHQLARRFGGEIDWESFERLFQQRLLDRSILVSRALENNFDSPINPSAERSRGSIEEYRRGRTAEWQQELFKQKARAANAERALREKETKRAREEIRIANSKIDALLKRLALLQGTDRDPDEARIFPMYHAPVLVQEHGRLHIRPMRYTCRLPGKPASFDRQFSGAYNARRDNLTGFWKPLFGQHHALMVVDSFFANVPTHLFERRTLKADEKETNTVLHFQPDSGEPMLVACVWAHWSGPDQSELDSFAAITDEPPAEIAATGHQRCIIALKPERVAAWLNPSVASVEELQSILADRFSTHYSHRIAA